MNTKLKAYLDEARRDAASAATGWSCTLLAYVDEIEEENRSMAKALGRIIASGRATKAELKMIAGIALVGLGKAPEKRSCADCRWRIDSVDARTPKQVRHCRACRMPNYSGWENRATD